MLEVNGVNSFYGKAQVLNDLNFTVDRGTVVALLGRNGAGKTTTMKSIMQLVRPRQGKIIYQGQDITGWPSHKVARNGLGYVPEERRIFTQLTVLENLEVGRQPPRDGCTTWTEDMVFDLFPKFPAFFHTHTFFFLPLDEHAHARSARERAALLRAPFAGHRASALLLSVEQQQYWLALLISWICKRITSKSEKYCIFMFELLLLLLNLETN